MRGVSRTVAVLALIVALAIPYTLAHSYLTNPISRSNQRQSNSGCRGPACLGPCEVPKDRATTATVRVQRGQTISVQWPRNNHAGGFVRLAWASWDKSDSHDAFDNGVQKIVCHEVGGCFPDNANTPNGGDSGPADGSSRACSTSITVPGHLSDGRYTLQWAWYGGAFALGDYYSCVDYEVSGGPTTAMQDPVFQGGDFTYPNQQKCKYFNTDALHVCVNEPCLNPPRPGERSGVPAAATLWGNRKPSTSTTGTRATTGTTGQSATTGTTTGTPASTSTTGSVTPPTTPVTTGSGTTGSATTTGGGGNTGICVYGTTQCNAAPNSFAQYQCCTPGAQCYNSGSFGICCGPYTAGCIFDNNTRSTCCDSRYFRCDSKEGCVRT